ncbi:MAG: MBOAT family protein [Clostridia bacterium]|nr:MBOAT family protein [Clostridia bacterium]
MLFNSFEFMIFFPVVTLLYFLLPHRFRWILLLSASCIFYMYFIPIYILVLFATILVDYFAGIYIENTLGRRRKVYLIASIISTCFILFIFKYFLFFNNNIAALAKFIGWNYPLEALSLVLPIGLSFHTFQSLSYVIEVYFGRQKAEKNFGIYALYVMFYPQLVAGPIERPQNMLHQFHQEHNFDAQRVAEGLKMMMWGMFKKVVIADRLAVLVNNVYNEPYVHSGLSLIIATIFFAIQIYCDFSGYSDIALGSAKVMGFNLMVNFNKPYFAKSIPEFWRRWHISLSTWFKDYVYIPLGGSRVSAGKWIRNIFIVFIISGFWHGANWTFIIWGALHGSYQAFSILTKPIREKISSVLKIHKIPAFKSFLQRTATISLVLIAWVFFRANHVGDAFYIIRNFFTGYDMAGVGDFYQYLRVSFGGLGFSKVDMVLAVLSVFVLLFYDFLDSRKPVLERLSDKPLWSRWAIYYAVIFFIIFFGNFGKVDFIYFQF